MQFCEEKNSAYLINCRLHSSLNSLHFITFQYIFKESTLKGGFLFHLIEWALCFNAFLMQFSHSPAARLSCPFFEAFWVMNDGLYPEFHYRKKHLKDMKVEGRAPAYPSAPKGLPTLSIKLPFPQHGQEHV